MTLDRKTILGMMARAGMGGGIPQVSLPQNLLSTPHTTLEDFEVIGDFTVEASSAAIADTTNFIHGTQSIQLTAPVAAQGYINKVFSPALDLSAAACVRIYFYIADKTKINAFALLLSHSASNYTNGFQYSVGTGAIRNGWNFKNIPKADFATMAAGNWANPIAQIRFRVTSVAGQQGVISWDYMTAGVLGTPAAFISFDDDYASVYTLAYPIMRAHNIRGTIYTISTTVGDVGRMTTAQLAELHAAGWDIANHSDNSTNLTTYSQADAQTHIAACKTYLDGLGLTRASAHLAYPSGGYNATVKAAATAAGILTGRATAETGPEYEILPFEDNLAIDPYTSLNATRTEATVESKITQAIAKGGILAAYGHEIVAAAPAGEQWLDTDLAALCNFIATNNLPCVTISELYRLMSGAVSVPKTV
jgi:peptidoglycan/xylan/chitin deacetylase (PgdA/CDA1 family)